jgi:hypothetical protein
MDARNAAFFASSSPNGFSSSSVVVSFHRAADDDDDKVCRRLCRGKVQKAFTFIIVLLPCDADVDAGIDARGVNDARIVRVCVNSVVQLENVGVGV